MKKKRSEEEEVGGNFKEGTKMDFASTTMPAERGQKGKDCQFDCMVGGVIFASVQFVLAYPWPTAY